MTLGELDTLITRELKRNQNKSDDEQINFKKLDNVLKAIKLENNVDLFIEIGTVILSKVDLFEKEVNELFNHDEFKNMFASFKDQFKKLYPLLVSINQCDKIDINDNPNISLSPEAAILGNRNWQYQPVDVIENKISVFIEENNLELASKWIDLMLRCKTEENIDDNRKIDLAKCVGNFINSNELLIDCMIESNKQIKIDKKSILFNYYNFENENNELKKQIKVLKEQCNQLKDEIINKDDLLKIVNGQNNSRKLEIFELESKLSDINQLLQSKEKELNTQVGMNKRITEGSMKIENELKAINSVLLQEKESLKSRLEEINIENNTFKIHVQDIDSDLKIYKKEAETLKANVETLIEEEKDKLIKKIIVEFTQTLIYLYSTLKVLHGDERENLLAIIDEFERTITSFGLKPYGEPGTIVVFNTIEFDDLSEETREGEEVTIICRGWVYKDKIVSKAIVTKE